MDDQGNNTQDQNLISGLNDQADDIATGDDVVLPDAAAASAGLPSVNDQPQRNYLTDEEAAAPEAPAVDAPADTPAPAAEPASSAPATGDEELLKLKQDALAQLAPIVDKVEMEPEEKFEVYMQAIRTNDDKTLVKPAFEAARSITDDEKRARALLNVVDEINYLTQDEEASN